MAINSKNGLFLGIDIDDEYSQCCYYDTNDKMVRPLFYKEDEPFFINSKNVKEVFENDREPEKILSVMLNALLQAAFDQTGEESVSALCICAHDYSPAARGVWHRAAALSGIDDDRLILIGEEESFAYFAHSGDPSVYAQGVVLYNFSGDKVRACFLRRAGYKGLTVLGETDETFTSEHLKKCSLGVLSLSDKVVSDELNVFFSRTLEKINVSSVYLTGPGFNVDSLPGEITAVLSRGGHRIFAGQNLFVKGACICAVAHVLPMADPFRSAGIYRNVVVSGGGTTSGGGRYAGCIMACRNRITTSIGLRSFEKGQTDTVMLVESGSNTDSSTKSFEVILTDDRRLVLELTPVGANVPETAVIELDGFPDRGFGMTRARVELFFPDEDTCEIKVTDIGFGAEYEATGVSVGRTVSLHAGDNLTMTVKSSGVIYCSDRKARVPYIFEETGRNIYYIQELVNYLYNNIYLVTPGVLNKEFLDFLDDTTGDGSLSDRIEQQRSEGVSFNSILLNLFREINYFTPKEVRIIQPVINEMELADPVMKKNSMAQAYLKNGCITRAVIKYEEIMESGRRKELPDRFYANVLHNMGVCYSDLLLYERAAKCFEKSYKLSKDQETKKCALYARRLSGTEPEIMHMKAEWENTAPEIEKIKNDADMLYNREGIATEEMIALMKEEYIREHS